MICQRTTKAVIHIFTQSGFSADIYLDGFFDAKIPALGDTAFAAELRSYGVSLQVPIYVPKRHPRNAQGSSMWQ